LVRLQLVLTIFDTAYLAEKRISFTDARGCNSDAVAEYVFTALFNISNEQKFTLIGSLSALLVSEISAADCPVSRGSRYESTSE